MSELKPPLATPTVAPFGTMTDGTEMQIYTLVNAAGASAAITNYGGTLTRLLMPGRTGRPGDVVLGYNTLAAYEDDAFFGTLIGHCGKRIKDGRFMLDGQLYQLPINALSNSVNGGSRDFDKRAWQAAPGTSAARPTLTLTYLSPAGEQGYPGTLDVQVVYTLAKDNVLCPKYKAVADAPMDFRAPHAIGERLAQVPGGYDHNWVLASAKRFDLAHAATMHEPTTGRSLNVYTDQPGMQFYSGNILRGDQPGRGGVAYPPHYGFCLETQQFPDSPNQPDFPGTVLRPGQVFRSRTKYRFGVHQ